jgi:glutaminyl-peptide cyclotransferase
MQLAVASLVLTLATGACGSDEAEPDASDPATITADGDTTDGDTGEEPATDRTSTSTGTSTGSGTVDDPEGAAGGPAGDHPQPDPPVSPSPEPLAGRLIPEVVASYPHDPGAFTQGLEWWDDLLLESTGLTGKSTLRLVDPTTGQPEVVVEVADELFAEGVTVVDGRALQLTWRNETLLVSELDQLGTAGTGAITRTDGAYDGEGWGLCYNGTELVMSDGSSQLAFRDPETFEALRTVEVTDDGAPVDQLNELECVGSQVWANVWRSDRIIAIDAETGEVEATVDATSLLPAGVNDPDDVLNGIAYHPTTGRFWLTGKRWPVLYEVELVPAGS